VVAELIAFRERDCDYWSDQGFVLAMRSQFEEASRCFERALAVDPHHVIALNGLARLLIERGRPGEALWYLDQACAVEPEIPEVWNNRGIALSRMDRTQDALPCFDAALSRDPADADVRANRALAYLQAEQFGPALADLTQVVAERPEWSEPWRYKGMVHLQMRQCRQARHAFLHAAHRGWASGDSKRKVALCLGVATGLGLLIRMGVGERSDSKDATAAAVDA
jgi:Flp pilus assembly protein TadD